MSLLDRGQREAEQHRSEAQARRERWDKEAWQRIASRFRGAFYEDHFIRNPDRRGYPSHVEDPENPIPPIEFVRWLGGGDTVRPARFTVEDITFEVEWNYEGGGDRAYWDDGWWPRWFVIRPGRWFLRDRRIQVYGPANVANALS